MWSQVVILCLVTNTYLCNPRCKGLCNKNHSACKRGILESDFGNCSTASTALIESTLTYVRFETTEVETYGKGKSYTRVEKVETELSLSEFLKSFREEFIQYAHHIVAAWFLRSTKLELFHPTKERKNILTIVSDFGEAFLVVRKHETADQFFKRPEVNLHGSVCSFLVPKADDESGQSLEDYSMSYIVSSDTKYEFLKNI